MNFVIFRRQVLKVFVRAVIEDIKDASGAPSGKLAPELKKLFGRITSKVNFTWLRNSFS